MDLKTALLNLTTWFEEYVKGFITGYPESDMNVELKKNHTIRVRDAIIDVGKSIALNHEDISIAEACAILHDIGRFEQHKKYGTFSDSQSENHAALGVKIIREHDALRDFPPECREIIIRSVGCHNMPAIPSGFNPDSIEFLKLIRDADKIDILYVVTDYYMTSASGTNKVLELHLPDTETISDEIFKPLASGQIAQVNNLRSLNDFKLYQMGWIYDLNYIRSLQIIRERQYLERLREALPVVSDRADQIYRIACSYLDNKLGGK
ncbi:MAG: HD domain-containing protein [Deltaproteobacteria bacterium]|nr:HD domain-containing protein [Deltaproteobacteria bacterium]